VGALASDPESRRCASGAPAGARGLGHRATPSTSARRRCRR
jgi:hypothetical protein